MNFPDMTNYVCDGFSFLWGCAGGFAIATMMFLICSIIKSFFSFARWYITRKKLRKSSCEECAKFLASSTDESEDDK